jgi:cell division protein FtsB
MVRLFRRSTPDPSDPDGVADVAADAAPEPAAVAPTPAAGAALGSLWDLPVAGLTRRRMALLIGALVAAWVIVLFARQVGDASAATARADAMRVSNTRLTADVAGLESELALIQKQAYIEQVAREFRLGEPKEIPFAVAPDAPPLGPDAPGSAAVRLGTAGTTSTALDSWARLLFGDPAVRTQPLDAGLASQPPASPGP